MKILMTSGSIMKVGRIKLRLSIKQITMRYFSILLLNPPTDVAEGVRKALFAYLKDTGYDLKI